MARIKPLKFTVVPTREAWPPVGNPPDTEIGSTYDPIFRALDKEPDMAVKITSVDSVPFGEMSVKERKGIQSALKEIANNRTREIQTKIVDGSLHVRLKD